MDEFEKKVFKVQKTPLSTQDAYDILMKFDSTKDVYTNNIRNPKSGEIYIFYTENSLFYGKFKFKFLIICVYFTFSIYVKLYIINNKQ